MIATQLLDIIRAEMADRGVSQRALAQRIGMYQPHLNRIINGHADPSLATIDRLLAGLGCEAHITITAVQVGDDWYDNLTADVDRLEEQVDHVLTEEGQRRAAHGVEVLGKLKGAARKLTEHVTANGPDERAHDADVRINALQTRVRTEVFGIEARARNGR